MRCRVCGGLLERRVTDLPFKIGDSSIVILKALPVLQCRQCGERSWSMLRCFASTKFSPESMRPPNLKSSDSQPELTAHPYS
jgi:YgiT-type zinc finger domain-containing protein